MYQVRIHRDGVWSILISLFTYSQITEKEAGLFIMQMMPAQKRLPIYHRTGFGFKPISRTWEMQPEKK